LNDLKFATENDVLEFIPMIKDIYLKPFSAILKTESAATIFEVFLYKLLNKVKSKCKKPTYWVEWEKNGKGKDFYRKTLSQNTRAYMIGRYQEYYYLQGDMREHLIDDFAFTRNIPESVGIYHSEITGNNSVSIHVRRGDYAGAKEFDVCSVNYFKNAVDYISGLVENPDYYVFSDDIEWTRKNFEFLGKYTMVDNSRYKNFDYFDLYLMTKCKHNIISNSTFSWWGAWLNQNRNKIIICPEKWNGLDLVYTDEICPKEWKRIKIS
jgi:hypothetical protein